MELIKVNQTEQGMTVDGRELHEFLGVQSKFADWIKNRIERFGFVEGEDFRAVSKILENGGRLIDYELSIDMAKEICMVENNEKGRQARRYFIECEKRLKQSTLQPMTTAEVIAAIANQAVEQERRIAALESGLNEAAKTLETVKETFTHRDEDWRKYINGLLNGAAYRAGTPYRELRNESYRLLEERGHCDLNVRLRNLAKRLEDAGATKTQIREANKMDVIESDPRLKEIYTTVVKELSIGSLAR